jgi:plasmid stabilization system protein ParE
VPRLIWSPPALRDVQRLYRFLAEKSPEAAKRAVKVIRDGVSVLSRQPGVGRPVEDMDPEFREWLIDFGDSGYVARYHWSGQTAVILAVRHQREAGYQRQG